MDVISTDVVIVGAGGAGLRAAIAAAEADPSLQVALLSKVYPMRSHTVAAEGGAAGVIKDNDSLDDHFHDTVSGGDWLCDQDAVELFVNAAPLELVQMEHWGCPWSREPDGKVAVRAVRRHEDRAHLVRRRQDRLPHAAHAVPDLAQISLDQALRRVLLDRPDRRGRALQGVVAIEMRSGRMVAVPGQGGDHRHRRRRPHLPVHHQRRDQDRRRHGDGLSRRRAAEGHGVHPVPPDRAARHRHPDHRRLRAAKAASWSTRTATAICRTTTSGRPTPGRARRRWSSGRATA